MRLKPLPVIRLFIRFLWHCVLSGLTTARLILKGQAPTAGLVAMNYEPMSETGVAILGAVVTLTPGSTAVDINLKDRKILLHFLDSRTAEKSIAAIRSDFEPDIRTLFPEERT